MIGVLISVAMGALMIFVAVQGLQRGHVPLGEKGLTRGDRWFFPAVAAFAAIGVGLWTFTGWVVLDDAEEARRPPTPIEGDGWQGAIPPTWERLPAEGLPPDASLWGDGQNELMVTQSRRALSLAEATPVEAALRDALENAAVTARPPRWRTADTSLAATWDYPSPRGPVKTTALGWITEGPTIHLVVAVCTDGAERGSCAETADSFTATRGMALTTEIPATKPATESESEPESEPETEPESEPEPEPESEPESEPEPE